MPLSFADKLRMQVFVNSLVGQNSSKKVKEWIEKDPSPSIDELTYLLSSSFVSSNKKSDIARNWILKKGGTKEDLAKILPLLSYESIIDRITGDKEDIEDQYNRTVVAQFWIGQKGRTKEDLAKILPLFNENNKPHIAQFWIGQKGRTKEDLVEILPLLSENHKPHIANSWIGQKGRTKENLVEILSLFSENDKPYIAKSWIEQKGRTKEDLDAVLPFFADKSRISEFWIEQEGRTKEDLDTVLPFFADKSRIAQSWWHREAKHKEENSRYDNLLYIAQNGLFPSMDDFENIANTYIYANLPSERFIEFCKMTYPNNEDLQTNLFVCGMSNLPSKNCLSGDSGLPKVSILSNYLKSKVPAIPEVDVKEFQFGESTILSVASGDKAQLSKKSKITQKFQKLLTKGNNASSSDVATFFENVLEEKIKEENQEKLAKFFRENKNELAFLFQQKEGLDKFVGVIGALGDGCVANIATQAKTALYQSIISDPCDQILFEVFYEKISTPTLNSGFDHLGGSARGVDIFSHSLISNSSFSPAGLVKAISEEFFKDGKIIQKPFEFLQNLLGTEELGKIYSKFEENLGDVSAENFPNNTDKITKAYFAELAAYFLIKEKLPDLLENIQLKGFVDKKVSEITEISKPDLNNKPSHITRLLAVEKLSLEEKNDQILAG